MALMVAWLLSGAAAVAGTAESTPAQHPLRPPDVSSPRATLDSLRRNLNQAYRLADSSDSHTKGTVVLLRRALRTLNLSEEPESIRDSIGIEAALHLKEIIDRIELPPLEQIPDKAEVNSRALKKWRLPNTEIVIARVEDGSHTGEWLFSPATVDNAADFYERIAHLPYRSGATPRIYAAYSMTPGPGLSLSWSQNVPRWLGWELFGQTLWQWFGGLLAGALAVGLILVLYRAARHADKSRATTPPSRRATILALLFAIVVAAGVEYFFDQIVNFTGGVLIFTKDAFIVILDVLIGWVTVLVLTQIPELIVRSRRLRPRGVDSQLLRLGFKLLAFVALAGLVIEGADRLGLPAYSVITGLGVGGLAVALAARETLANVLGSLAIMLDRPFRTGDWIKIGSDEGTVEDIGFRSTRIRTFYDSLLSIPNATTVNAVVDNMGQRTYRRVYTRLNIRYDTKPGQIEAFIEGIKGIIREHPTTRKDYFHVVLHDLGSHSLEIMVYFFLQVPDWSKELVDRQQVLGDILHLADSLGVQFAFPTQTIELDRWPASSATTNQEPAFSMPLRSSE